MSPETFKSVALRGTVALAIVVASASLQAAPIIFSQPVDANGAVSPASQTDTSVGGQGAFAQTFDDFVIAQAACPACTNYTVTDLHWTGAFFNPATESQTVNFTASFYQNNAGAPGALIQSFGGLGNPKTPAGACPTNNAGLIQCNYSVDPLAGGGLTLNFGTTYWLSIVASSPFPPQWGWRTSGAGNSVQDFFGVRSVTGFNQAFDLTGTLNGGGAVPEPATLALLGMGLAGLGFARRRRSS